MDGCGAKPRERNMKVMTTDSLTLAPQPGSLSLFPVIGRH